LQKKYDAEISENEILGEKILLAKPQTFMNESGKSAKALIKNFKLKIKNCIVIQDDVDLPVGKIKIVKDRGSAGHKGIESIIQNIGNENLIRFRIGIKPASAKGFSEAKKIVLKKFSKEEKELVNNSVKKTCDALNLFLKSGLEKTMNEFNK